MSSPCTYGGRTGTKFSYAELEGLWIKAGGSKAVAPVAAAISLAESGGCSAALNPRDTNGLPSGGLWQLNPAPANWADPASNAAGAVAKYRGAGNSFSPWGTFTSGAYKGFLSGKTTPNLNVPGSSGNTPAQTTAAIQGFTPATCLWSFPGIAVPFLGNVGQFCLLSKPMARGWIGAALLAGGGLMALPGVALLVVAAGMSAAGPLGRSAERLGGVVAVVPGLQAQGAAIAGAGSVTARPQQAGQRRSPITRSQIESQVRSGQRSPVGRQPGEPQRYAGRSRPEPATS